MRRLKFTCREVSQVIGWDGRTATRVSLSVGDPNQPSIFPVTSQVFDIQAEPGRFKPGQAYYATFESAEEIADKS